MKVTIIAGARPNFMKVAPIIHAIKKEQQNGKLISYRLVHTGQHYDNALSGNFFSDLSIPIPDANLEVGSGSQAVQTANIMIRFEEELLANLPDVVLVVGDINSTMACSIVAKKVGVQLVHVEAGIRSFDLSMPEEINRMVTDSITDHYFTTSIFANSNLLNTGVGKDRIHYVGNTMIDSLLSNMGKFVKPKIWEIKNLSKKEYFVLTLHRPSNVDSIETLENIVTKIDSVTGDIPIIFPVHPRTLINLKKLRYKPKNMVIIDPLRYLEFMYLVKNAWAVITDSGGIQEETTVLGVPCITLRKNSERPETITDGTNELVWDINKLDEKIKLIINGNWKAGKIPELWDGKTSERITKKLIELYC